MTFKSKPAPTFDASLTITGQGVEQKLDVTYRAKTRTQYGDLLTDIASGKVEVADAVLQLVEKWNVDMPLSAASINELDELQPGIAWAILNGYGDELTVARKGN